MGLTSQSLNGEDFNPAMYFVNDNKAYLAKARAALDTVFMPAMKEADAAVQSDSSSPSHPTGALTAVPFLVPTGPLGTMTLVTLPMGQVPISLTTSLVGNADAVMKQVNIPGYTMREAFPTFKLFFMEDASNGIYDQVSSSLGSTKASRARARSPGSARRGKLPSGPDPGMQLPGRIFK